MSDMEYGSASYRGLCTTGIWLDARLADPVNCMTSIKTNGTMNNANDVLNMGVSHWDYTEFDEMVEAADLIVDLEERYQAFGAIENYLLENAYYIPFISGWRYI